MFAAHFAVSHMQNIYLNNNNQAHMRWTCKVQYAVKCSKTFFSLFVCGCHDFATLRCNFKIFTWTILNFFLNSLNTSFSFYVFVCVHPQSSFFFFLLEISCSIFLLLNATLKWMTCLDLSGKMRNYLLYATLKRCQHDFSRTWNDVGFEKCMT